MGRGGFEPPAFHSTGFTDQRAQPITQPTQVSAFFLKSRKVNTSHLPTSSISISKNKCRCTPGGTRTLKTYVLSVVCIPVPSPGQLQGYSYLRHTLKATRNFMCTSRLPCNLKEIRFIAFSPTKLSPNFSPFQHSR